jgi:hypothetical protein
MGAAMTAYNLECLPVIYYITNVAWVAERVDARDLKSLGRKAMPVRVRPQAPIISISYRFLNSLPNGSFWLMFPKSSHTNLVGNKGNLS